MKKNGIAKASKRRTPRATKRPLYSKTSLQSGTVRATTTISTMTSDNEYQQQSFFYLGYQRKYFRKSGTITWD